jgi:hypothetical protein
MGFFDKFGGKKEGKNKNNSLPLPPMPENKNTSVPPVSNFKNNESITTQTNTITTTKTMPRSSPPDSFKSNTEIKENSLFQSSPIIQETKKITTIKNPDQSTIDQLHLDATSILPNNNNLSTSSKNNLPNKLPDLNIPTPTDDILPEFDDSPSISFFEENVINLPQIPAFETTNIKTESQILSNDNHGPLYIRTDDFSQILSNVDNMKKNVSESPNYVYMLKNLKKNTDIEHKNYAKLLEDIQRKLIYVDNLLFETMRN